MFELNQVCPKCGDELTYYERKVLTTTEWTDYDGRNTRRAVVEYEVIHPCGQPAPVEDEVPKGYWRHSDNTPCVSYPDSIDWTYDERSFWCSHNMRMVCHRRQNRT